jgi:phage terminase Nu1 subunit (DNA packaging protein)
MDCPANVTSIVLAKLLSTNRSTVTRLTNQGVLKKSALGYNVVSSIASHTAHRERLVAAKAGEGAYGRARAALVTEKAQIARMQREKMQGSMIAADEATERWSNTCENMKTKFLATPAKLARQLAEESSPAKCQKLLRDATCENLETLSRGEFIPKVTR